MASVDPEPLLAPSNDRLVLFPIQHAQLWEQYQKQVACFWTPAEIDLKHDKQQFDALKPGERHYLKMILAFFATADNIVNENLLENFATEVQVPEARFFYSFQATMENIHAETYGLLIDTLLAGNDSEKHRLFKSIETVPTIKQKADWSLRWCDSRQRTFAERLIAFAAVEGIFFSSSFCAIYWIKQRGILPGLCQSNELIARDEGMHCDFAVHLHHMLLRPAAPLTIRTIISDAVEIESNFVRAALPCGLIGMNSDQMVQYVQFCADRLLTELGQPKIFRVENPFHFMELISLQGKTNFFEKRVSEYALSGVGDTTNHHVFDLDVSF
jgi:ribonucleotide reductase beta subunit family protein with ferritin-like domain